MKDYKFCPICGKPLQTGIIEKKKRGYCPHCGFINYKNPLPSVGAVAIEDEKILLIKRGIEPGKGFWALPSGFIEKNENPEDACLRELKEETGMQGKILKIIGAWLERTKIYGDVIVIMYLVKINGGKLEAGDDAADAKFFKREDIPDIHFNCFRKAIERLKIKE